MTTRLQSPQSYQPIQREPLRWLFKALFNDGSSIEQDQEDKSETRTDGTGSRFTDVLQREDELKAFGLVNTETGEEVYVDLKTGNFQVGQTPVCAHDQNFEPQHHKLRLIYFRETRVEQQIQGTVQSDDQVKEEPVGEPRHFVNRYFIGWQTDVNGKNHKATIAVG